MEDFISRQKAINTLEKRKDKNAKGDIGRFYNQIIQSDIDHLKELPSAEPEIIRCKDCKHRPIDTGKDNNPEDFECSDDICPCVCADYFYSWMPDDDWFCANGERTDGDSE